MLSQEDVPQTHRTTRQIARETTLNQWTVGRVGLSHGELKPKGVKKRRAQQMTAQSAKTLVWKFATMQEVVEQVK